MEVTYEVLSAAIKLLEQYGNGGVCLKCTEVDVHLEPNGVGRCKCGGTVLGLYTVIALAQKYRKE